MEIYQDHSFQVDSLSVPNAPMGITRHVHQERVKGLTWTKMGFPYSWILNLLPKRVWRQRGGLHLGPNSVFQLWQGWDAHSHSDTKTWHF